MLKNVLFIFVLFNSLISFADNSVQTSKIALVYKGPGSCPEECSEAAAEVARKSGLSPVFVGPHEENPDLFNNVAVWIQPGGVSSVAGKNMTAKLKNQIRKFVHDGGAYVGFCAGGFLASDKLRDPSTPGLGLIRSESHLYLNVDHNVEILSLNWKGHARQVYWEGGPYFDMSKASPESEIIATYPDGTVATLFEKFGKGKVVVTGAHPEAPAWWSDDEGVTDQDDIDHDLAVEMVLKAITK